MAIVHVTTDTFQKEVLEAEGKVIVDFWATWCGPCKMVAPIFEELSNEKTDVKFCKIDVDENMELAQQFRVMSIPMFYVFENGKPVNRAMGAISKDEIINLIG